MRAASQVLLAELDLPTGEDHRPQHRHEQDHAGDLEADREDRDEGPPDLPGVGGQGGVGQVDDRATPSISASTFATPPEPEGPAVVAANDRDLGGGGPAVGHRLPCWRPRWSSPRAARRLSRISQWVFVASATRSGPSTATPPSTTRRASPIEASSTKPTTRAAIGSRQAAVEGLAGGAGGLLSEHEHEEVRDQDVAGVDDHQRERHEFGVRQEEHAGEHTTTITNQIAAKTGLGCVTIRTAPAMLPRPNTTSRMGTVASSASDWSTCTIRNATLPAPRIVPTSRVLRRCGLMIRKSP